MKLFSPVIHGVLDYATVVWFAIAPSLFGFSGIAAALSYTLAIVHLSMTILSDMPLGLIKLIPMKLHSFVELIVGPTLILGALVFAQHIVGAQWFYIASGVAICAVWYLSEYTQTKAATSQGN
jgi:hypothetical protein